MLTNYRIVSRDTLADLEAAVKALYAEGHYIDRNTDASSITLNEALLRAMGKSDSHVTSVQVSMKKDLP